MIEIDIGEFVNSIVKRFITTQNLVKPSVFQSLLLRLLMALAILLATIPLATRAATTLEDSAQALGQKIVAALPTKDAVSMTVHNVSSMDSSEVARVERAIEEELVSQGIHPQPEGTAATRIVITLSENFSGLIWTAQIQIGDASRFVIVSAPKEDPGTKAPSGAATILHAEKFWEGPQRILDAAQISLPDGGQSLALLTPGALSIRDATGERNIAIPIDLTSVNLRTLTGRIYRVDSQLTVQMGPSTCSVSTDLSGLQECHPVSSTANPPPIPNRGDQTAIVHSLCGAPQVALETGTGDYSQPDMIQALNDQSGAAIPTGNALNFPGPILALHEFVDGSTMATAIVRNLKTQNYEAYYVSTSCGQ